MAASQFEQGPGTKRLIHVQKTFERFSLGKPGDRSMNQNGFQMLCEEMGMVSPEMSKRLFLAMDDDNTGAMEATEFLHGLRLMCDESGGEQWKKKRVEFAFNLFDLDREKTVDQSEIKSFLKTFYSEARGMIEAGSASSRTPLAPTLRSCPKVAAAKLPGMRTQPCSAR